MLETPHPPASKTLTVAALGTDLEETEFLRSSFSDLVSWTVGFAPHESVAGLLAHSVLDPVGLVVLTGERAPEQLRELRDGGYGGAALVLVGGGSDHAQACLRSGADVTLQREDLEPVFLESITRVALTLPHRSAA